MINRISSYTRIVAVIAIFLIAGDLVAAAQAADSTPRARAEPVHALDDDTGTIDFILVNIRDSDRVTRSFAAGGEICLDVVVEPLPLPGSPVLTSRCYSGLPGQSLIAAPVGIALPRSSSYSLWLASNTTDCTVSLPAMEYQDFGDSGAYAIFNAEADCPNPSFPTVVIPDPTRVVPLPTFDFPTPTPTIDSTTPRDVPPVAAYERVTLRFVPLNPDLTPLILPGEICARLVVNPGLTGDPLVNHCHTRSTALKDYFPTEGTTFPMASVYSAIVVSNESGCTATPGAFREYMLEFGEVAELDILISCDGTSPTVLPSPTQASTEIASTAAYEAVHVELRDSSGGYRYYDAPICFDVAITPAAGVSGNEWVCQYYASSSGTTISVLPGPDALLTSSAYTANVFTNETGCDVSQSFRTEGTAGYITILTTCPAPETFASVRLLVLDRGGAERVALPGELCVAVVTNPPLSAGDRVGELCSTVVESSETWLPTAADTFSYLSDYTTGMTRNPGGCSLSEPVRSLESDDGGLHLQLAVWVTCGDTAPTATPSPDATGAPTELPVSTAVPTDAPGSMATTVPTSTSSQTPTPSAGPTDPAPKSPSPTQVATTPVPSVPPTLPTATVISGLPKTGSGSWGQGSLSLLILVGGLSLVTLGAGAVGRRARRS